MDGKKQFQKRGEKMKTIAVMAVLSVMTLYAGMAAELAHPEHRAGGGILVTSKDVVLTPQENCTHPSWLKEKKQYAVLGSVSKVNEQSGWIKISFSFLPDKNGKIRLSLLGGGVCKPNYFQKEENECRVVWDSIDMQGAKIVNGSFEDVGSKQYPNGWKSQSTVSPEKNGIKPHHGKFMLPVSRNHQAAQENIPVTAGQKITISAWIRFFECMPPK